MDRTARTRLVTSICCLILAISLSDAGAATTASPDSVAVEQRGGSLIVLEQATATWCETCAEHEQWLPTFDAANEARVQRVALHPVENDPLGNPASTLRLAAAGADQKGFVPIYHFDGVAERLTSQNARDMQSSLLTAEAARATFEAIEVTAEYTPERIHLDLRIAAPTAIENTTITLLILERIGHLDPVLAENGVIDHPFLLSSLVQIPLDGSAPLSLPNSNLSSNITSDSTISANISIDSFADPASHIIVVMHEYSEMPAGEPRTLSALRLSFSSSPAHDASSMTPWLTLLLAGGVVTLVAARIRR